MLASIAGEFYYGTTTAVFGDVREPDRQVPAAGGRLGLQGQRRLAARRRRQGELKDGDVVLWYYATFGPAGGPPTLELQRLPGNCYVVAVASTTPASGPAPRPRRSSRTASGSGRGRPGLHRQARRARPGDRARRRPLERVR